MLGRSRGIGIGLFRRKSQPAGPGCVDWVKGSCALLAVLACLSEIVYCRSDAVQNQFKMAKKSVRSFQFASLIGSAVSSFSSVQEKRVKRLRSVRSVQFIPFTNSSGPDVENLSFSLGCESCRADTR